MKLNFKKFILLAVVMCIFISLVSCTQNKAVTDIELPPDFLPNPTGKIKVSTWLRSGDASEIALDKWIKVYNEKYPNVVIKKDIIPWGSFDTQIAAGDIGDVYYSAEVGLYSRVVEARACMALDAYINALDIDISEIYTNLYELGCVNGRLYMVPSDLSQNVFFTNVTALTEAGLERPENDWTWDDYREYCQKLKKVAVDGTYEQVGSYYPNELCYITHFFSGWGGQWVDKVNKKVNFISDENVLRGFTELIDIIDKGYAYVQGLTGAVGALYANVPDPYGFVFRESTWINRVSYYEQFEALGLQFDVTAMPSTPTRVMLGGATGYIVYSKTKNPDAAATFALTLLSDEGQKAFNEMLGGGIPCTKNAIEAGGWRIPYPEDEFNYDAFVCFPEAFTAAWPSVHVPPEVSEIISSTIPSLVSRHFSNIKDYRDTLEECEEACNQKWAQLF